LRIDGGDGAEVHAFQRACAPGFDEGDQGSHGGIIPPLSRA
jgi:hypothetical protein